MKEVNVLDTMRTDLINAGFKRTFINGLNQFALATLYDLWDVEDPDEQEFNVDMFIEEYRLDRRKVFQ